MGVDEKPAEIAKQGLAKARAEDYDAVIVDTAGRLQVGKCPPQSAMPPASQCFLQASRFHKGHMIHCTPYSTRACIFCSLNKCSHHHGCKRKSLTVQIDPAMMSELREVQATVQPSDTLLVVDAMTGQEAAGLVKAFNEAAEITGDALLPTLGISMRF